MKKYIKSYTNNYFGGAEWEEEDYPFFIDGEWGTYTKYSRKIDDKIVTITPKYIKKSDMLVYEVAFYSISDPAKQTTTESFETFYDAMDFVDSGEMTDKYL